MAKTDFINVNNKQELLATVGIREYWLGSDLYVYQFNDGKLVGYLCTKRIWDEVFYPSIAQSRPTDISTITEYGLTQKLSRSIRCFQEGR